MTDADAGTDGRKPDRPRGGPATGGIVSPTPRRWLAQVLVVVGGAVAVAGGGVAFSLATDKPVIRSTQPSAPNDPQAGDFVLLPSTTPLTIPGAGATRSPIAASDLNAAAAIAIHIPRLKVSRDLIGLRIQPDRSLTVPEDFDDIGWWSGGPHPGGPGAALFVGHFSSRTGPAVFFDLRSTRVGDLITVDRGDQTSALFKVVGRASFPRRTFPDEVVYRTVGKPSIHLVTCDGAFDQKAGHHLDNLVVFADLVSTGRTSRGTR